MRKKAKNITLETLSGSINTLTAAVRAGFKGTDEQFKGMDVKFKGIDEQFKGMDVKFKGIDEQFKGMDVKMSAGFKKVNEDIELLAQMTARGFDDVTAKLAAKADKSDIAALELGQENIQLRLDSMAPQFELQQLQRRVKRLEDRAGIRHPAR